MIGNPLPAEPRARIAWEVRAVAGRFRNLSQARLAAPIASYGSRAEAGRRLAQHLADAAVGVAERTAPGPPAVREVPVVDVFAVGEQIAVTGNDLIAELAEVSDADLVWYDDRRTTVAELIAETIDALRRLRLAL